MTVSTAVTSIGSTDYFQISQKIEANNMSDFGWGTASGQSVTVSFWAKCSNAITLSGALQSSSSPYTSYPFTFTINSANTWQYITVSIPAPASGTNWSTGTNTGIYFQINLAVGTSYSGTANAWNNSNLFGATGASSLMGTVSNYLYITGVQLEVGSQATSFDFRDYGRELILCQRYYTKLGVGTSSAGIGVGVTSSTTSAQVVVPLPVTMRASPTSTVSNMAITDWQTYTTTVTPITLAYACTTSTLLAFTSSGFTAFRPALFTQATSAGYTDFSAEL
jgi:hypothetical protein